MNGLRAATLGSAAVLGIISTASAADLPVKAKAIEYVKVCSLYGAGFYYIPGTDTCVKIGGAIRLDTTFNGSVYDGAFWQGGSGGNGLYTKDYYYSRERFNFNIDTRTATEYGVVRTYANTQMQWSQNVDNIAGGNMEVDFAFIQFAGFTFGKAVSNFDPQWTLARPTISSGHFGGSYDATGIPQIAYTAAFGNGISGSIALENGQAYRQAGVYNINNPIVAPGGSQFLNSNYGVMSNTWLGNSTGGQHMPDILGNVRLDQSWGSLHFAGAVHQVTTGFYGANESTGHPEDAYGYAFTGAVEFKNLATGAGDSLKLEASYAKGAAKYVFGGTVDTAGAGRFASFNGNTLGFGYVLDGVFAPGGQTQLSNSWEVSAYFEHYWNPAWRTSLWGDYNHIDYGAGGNALLFAAAAAGKLSNGAATGNTTAGTLSATGNWDLNLAQIGTRTAWTPVQNLTLAAEFSYSRLDQNLNGTYTGTASGKALNTYTLKDQNLYNGSVQILRSF